MLRAVAISAALLATASGAVALPHLPGPRPLVDHLLDVATEHCPAELVASEAAYETVDHPEYVGFWGEPDPAYDRWYINAAAWFGTFRGTPEYWKGMAWLLVTVDLVALPIEIGVLANGIRKGDAADDLQAQEDEIEGLIKLLEATISLEDCLLPTDIEFVMIGSTQGEDKFDAVLRNLECRNWRTVCKSLIASHAESADVWAFVARADRIIKTEMGRCAGDKPLNSVSGG